MKINANIELLKQVKSTDKDYDNEKNMVYEDKYINLTDYMFPENEFVFEFNIRYIFTL